MYPLYEIICDNERKSKSKLMIWSARAKRFYNVEILWAWRKAKSFKT
jgi:hypothetical protein